MEREGRWTLAKSVFVSGEQPANRIVGEAMGKAKPLPPSKTDARGAHSDRQSSLCSLHRFWITVKSTGKFAPRVRFCAAAKIEECGQWSVVSGQWSVVSGQWSVVSQTPDLEDEDI
jgi:hypothetical protein